MFDACKVAARGGEVQDLAYHPLHKVKTFQIFANLGPVSSHGEVAALNLYLKRLARRLPKPILSNICVLGVGRLAVTSRLQAMTPSDDYIVLLTYTA